LLNWLVSNTAKQFKTTNVPLQDSVAVSEGSHQNISNNLDSSILYAHSSQAFVWLRLMFLGSSLKSALVFSQNRFGVLQREPYVCEAGQTVGLWHYVPHQKSTAQ
jgi:hypothetical protein